ncbi:EamA family transporter RarD [Thalassotalea fusca]
MADSAKSSGVLFALLSTILWGSYPLWYSPLREIAAVDVLAFRVIGSFIFVVVFLLAIKNVSLADLKQLVTRKSTLKIVVSSAIVTAVWWLTYIYAVAHSLVLEASLGYFISPIISVFFGFVLFKERPSMSQWLAISITFVAIANLVYNYGQTPWIAIIIGACFSLYAAIRKGQTIKPLPGLGVECFILLPFSIAFLLYQTSTSGIEIYAQITSIQWLFLLAIGLISVLPLWWYTIAAQKLEMITLSFFQLIPPTCNFLFAVFLFNETFTNIHLVTFGLIWLASAAYFVDKLQLFKPKLAVEGENT